MTFVFRINQDFVPKGTTRGRARYSTNIKSLLDSWSAKFCIVSSDEFEVTLHHVNYPSELRKRWTGVNIETEMREQ